LIEKGDLIVWRVASTFDAAAHKLLCQPRIQGDSMDTRNRFGSDAITPKLLRLGLWLRGAFAGAALAAAGVAALFDTAHPIPLSTALTWILAGATLAWVAWQRATALLEPSDEEPSASLEYGPSRHDRVASEPQRDHSTSGGRFGSTARLDRA
jgi:hypothetical protein